MIITPSSTSVLDNSSANTVLATISVTMASGDPFVGTFSSSNPIVGFSGSDIVLARDLTPSDVAALNITITATTAPPVPTSISVTPSSVNEPDNAVSGTIVATIAVTMSDGSSYAGTPTSSNPGIFGISGMNVVLARDLVAGDDGFYNVTISP